MPGANNSSEENQELELGFKREAFMRTRLGEADYYGLAAFFLKSFFWHVESDDRDGGSMPYLITFVTRRCHVLAQMFLSVFLGYADTPKDKRPRYLQNWPLHRLDGIARRHFITDSALAAMGGQLADYYVVHGRLPAILVCDEVLVYGRSLNSVFTRLEACMSDRIFDAYSSASVAREVRAMMLQRLRESVELYVYARNDRTLLLYSRYQRHLRQEKKCSSPVWRDLSKCLSSLIADADISNTAYSWGLRLETGENQDRRALRRAIWEDSQGRQDCRFRKVVLGQDFRKVIYLFFYPNAACPKAIGTVRVKKNSITDDLTVVPFLFMGKIPVQAHRRFYSRLCGETGEKLRFLAVNARYLDGPAGLSEYAGWLEEVNSLFLGKLLLEDWLRAVSPPGGEAAAGAGFQAELVQLSRNFKTLKQTLGKEPEDGCEKELEDLLRGCRGGRLEAYLEELLEDAEPLWESSAPEMDGGAPPAQGESAEGINRAIEDVVADLGLEAERDAYGLFKSGVSVEGDPFTKGGKSCSLNSLFSRVADRARQSGVPFCPCYMAAAVVQVMDLGLISLGPAHDRERGLSYTNARAGEQALFVHPARYQEYLLALRAIHSISRQNHLDLDREIDRFVGCLPERECGLADALKRFVRELTESGQDLKEWDFPLVDNMVPFGEAKWNTALQMVKKQFQYLSLYRNSLI